MGGRWRNAGCKSETLKWAEKLRTNSVPPAVAPVLPGPESWNLSQSNSTVKQNQLSHAQFADSGPNSAPMTPFMEPAQSSGASPPPETEP